MGKMTKLYYVPPPEKQFEELKEKCIEIWEKPEYLPGGYSKEKTSQIKRMKNIKDNFMYMVAMLDDPQQTELANNLSLKTRIAVRDRLRSANSQHAEYPF